MAKVTYFALLEPAEDGGYGVVFPDLDGCVTAGATQDEAFRNAHEALSLHLEGMAEEGMAIPPPSNLTTIAQVIARAHFAGKPPVAYVGITVEAPDAAERVNVYLAKSLLDRIDRFCEETTMNRSGFFNVAARRLLDREEGPDLSVWEKLAG